MIQLNNNSSVDFPYEGVVTIGLSWVMDTHRVYDLDAHIFCSNLDGDIVESISYKNMQSDKSGFIRHFGDCVTGGCTGDDDEKVQMVLSEAPEDVVRVSIVVNIHSPISGNFSDMESAKLRIMDCKTLRYSYDITQSEGRSLVVAHFDRTTTGWMLVVKSDYYNYSANKLFHIWRKLYTPPVIESGFLIIIRRFLLKVRKWWYGK